MDRGGFSSCGPDRTVRSVTLSSNPPMMSEVIAPPANFATTARPSTHPKPINFAPQSVGQALSHLDDLDALPP
jgi:hypothetical protein